MPSENKSMNLEQVIDRLKTLADPEKVNFKREKYAIEAQNSLGVYQRDLNVLAKEIGKNDDLAIALFDTGIYEGRVLCSKIFTPKNVTSELMEKWVCTFENWEICDSFCMALFAKSAIALPKAEEWTSRSSEFEKRAGFAISAAYCTADKKAENDVFESMLPWIKRESNDNRVYVKKAVNWALRNIGKRNNDLNQSALSLASELSQSEVWSAQWIGQNAVAELSKPDVRMSDYPRHRYRP